jgi:rhamnose utilization protein RhaD (predicted bifunctional aldolase and dehydrogenase)
MICPLLAIFSGTKEKYDSNIGVITEAAKHIDSQSTQVFQALNEGKKVEIMPDTEFEAWMITTNQHKVKLLKLLTKFVKEWNPTE